MVCCSGLCPHSRASLSPSTAPFRDIPSSSEFLHLNNGDSTANQEDKNTEDRFSRPSPTRYKQPGSETPRGHRITSYSRVIEKSAVKSWAWSRTKPNPSGVHRGHSFVPMTTSLSLGNLFPGPVINSSILSFSGIGITSYPGAKPTGKCADCFDPGKNTFPIIHMFLLEGLPTRLGHAGLWAATAGSAYNSTSGSTTGTKQWFSARRDTHLPGNQWQCQDISHCHN